VRSPRLPLVPCTAILVMLLAEVLNYAVAESNVVLVLFSAGTSASAGNLVLAGSFIVLRLLALLVAGPVLLAWATLFGWSWWSGRRNGSAASQAGRR
jgi:hypothetical protein